MLANCVRYLHKLCHAPFFWCLKRYFDPLHCSSFPEFAPMMGCPSLLHHLIDILPSFSLSLSFAPLLSPLSLSPPQGWLELLGNVAATASTSLASMQIITSVIRQAAGGACQPCVGWRKSNGMKLEGMRNVAVIQGGWLYDNMQSISIHDVLYIS